MACALFAVVVTLWPGDAPWGGDDVMFVGEAIHSNQQGSLMAVGFVGSVGYPYGPVAVQVYQAIVAVSPDIYWVVRIHAFLFVATTSVALLWLAAELRVSAWWVLLVMAGPFFWFYTRLLWDNSMGIPLGTLFLASWASVLRRPSRFAFLVSVACGAFMPFIHPMTLPLVGAVLLHALCFHRKLFKLHWIGVALVGVCLWFSCIEYVLTVAFMLADKASPEVVAKPLGALTPLKAVLFPLLGGRLLSAYYFFDERGPEHGLETTTIGHLCRNLTAIAFGLVWLGIWKAIVNTWQRRKLAASPERSIIVICLVALGLQMLLDGVMRVAPFPHYFNGTWVIFVVFLWLGLKAIRPVWLSNVVAASLGICLAISTVFFAIDIHRQRGGPVWYKRSMEAQLGMIDQHVNHFAIIACATSRENYLAVGVI